MKGKVAIVTGCTSGIGLGIATQLAKNGCNIVLNGFASKDIVDNIIMDLEKYSVEVIYSKADMSKPIEIEEMIEYAVKKFGRLDILVNNAGIQHVSPIDEFPEDKWEAIMSINLTANFHTIKHSLKYMKKQNWGRIINIASTHGKVGSANKSAYVAAKHGVVGLSKVVALEIATLNITCNSICPGWVLTDLVQKQVDDNAKQKNISIEQAEIELLAEKQPSLKFVKSSDIGCMVVYLCSEAASQITGTELSIDGGWLSR